MVKLHAEHGGFEDVVMEAESAGAPKPKRRFEAVSYPSSMQYDKKW
jgi:hypothetical protein